MMISNQPRLFDILDYDDDDELEHDTIEEFKSNYPFDSTYNNIQGDDEEQEELIKNISRIEIDDMEGEQILSQRLCQLLTTTTIPSKTMVESRTKKFRVSIDEEDETDLMPDYLLSRNKLFDPMIESIISITNPIDMDDLRQMAFFLHQRKNFEKLHDVWSTYLRAGIGLLKEDSPTASNQIDQRYWSNDVKSVIQSQPNLYPINMTIEQIHIACQDIVYQQLSTYKERMELYQSLFNTTQTSLTYWSSTLEKAIQTFVQQYGMVPLQMKYDHKIEILTYEYQEQIFEQQILQQQLTDAQKQIARCLYDTELQLEIAKYDLIEYQERIRYNKPPILYDCLEILISSSHLRLEWFNRYEKLIQQTKMDLITVHIAALQAKIEQYQIRFNKEIEQMWQNKKMPPILTQLITKRSINMNEKYKVMSHFTINYAIRNSYADFETSNRKEKEQTLKRIRFPSTLIIASTITSHQLTKRQLQLLNRGPTYVAPGQLHIFSASNETNEAMIKKQYGLLKHQLAIFFEKYKINLYRQNYFYNTTWEDFQRLYSVSLPQNIHERALYEKKLIQSIQYFLKKNNLIVRRTADQNNVFYLGSQKEFIEISNRYLQQNTNYKIFINLNETNRQQIQAQLLTKYQTINTTLENLYATKKLTEEMFGKLRLNINRCKLPYLYFLPDYSMNSHLEVEPMISTYHSATQKLAEFIYHLLRPHVSNILDSATFINEIDFMQKLNSYQEHSRLQPTTLFATIKIRNFHALVSHETLVAQLGYFFLDYSDIKRFPCTSIRSDKPQSISINTVQELIRLVLENNIFYYDRKIYSFTKGGPNSQLLCELLSNIYLFNWQKQIFSTDPRFKTEFSGRYKNQLIFTWNRSKDELETLIKNVVEQYSHIHLETSIHQSVSFLNVYIENKEGQLRTSVYHHPHRQKYTLPYTVGHATIKPSLWFRSALLRAILLCTNYTDFMEEQLYLQITCLTNGYSRDFIEIQLKYFYQFLNTERIRYCFDPSIYAQFRLQLFNFRSEQYNIWDHEQKLEDHNHVIYFYYPYDYGSYQQFKKKFHEHWSTYIKDDPQLPSKQMKIILNAKHIYSLNALLARQKPFDDDELLKT